MIHKQYKATKRLTIPVGHRLSKHLGRCKNWHGHNFDILISVSSHELNDNDMVMDFSDLKKIAMTIIDDWDHCLLINENDPIAKNEEFRKEFRIITFPFDPTAERMSEILYANISSELQKDHKHIHLDEVTVFENENSNTSFKLVDTPIFGSI